MEFFNPFYQRSALSLTKVNMNRVGEMCKNTWGMQMKLTSPLLAKNIQLIPEFNLDVTINDPSMDTVYQVIIIFRVGHHLAAPISCRGQSPHFKRVCVPDMIYPAFTSFNPPPISTKLEC